MKRKKLKTNLLSIRNSASNRGENIRRYLVNWQRIINYLHPQDTVVISIGSRGSEKQSDPFGPDTGTVVLNIDRDFNTYDYQRHFQESRVIKHPLSTIRDGLRVKNLPLIVGEPSINNHLQKFISWQLEQDKNVVILSNNLSEISGLDYLKTIIEPLKGSLGKNLAVMGSYYDDRPAILFNPQFFNKYFTDKDYAKSVKNLFAELYPSNASHKSGLFKQPEIDQLVKTSGLQTIGDFYPNLQTLTAKGVNAVFSPSKFTEKRDTEKKDTAPKPMTTSVVFHSSIVPRTTAEQQPTHLPHARASVPTSTLWVTRENERPPTNESSRCCVIC